MWQNEIMGLLVISTLSIAMTTVIACVHSGYITVTMTATARAIVQTTLTLTTTMTTVASSSASRCNSSTAAQPLKLPALPPRPCELQLHHSCQNHSTSQQPAQCSQPQHIPSGPHVRPFQLQQSDQVCQCTFQRDSQQAAASFQQQPASSQQPTASSQQAAAAMTAATAVMMMMTLCS